MSVSLHAFAVQTFAPMLRGLSGLIDKGAEHARTSGSAPDALTEARLAPDMLPLKHQVRFTCLQACQGVARLIGEEPPEEDGPEDTLEDLKARIARAVVYIEAAPAARFEGAEDRPIRFHLFERMWFEGNGLQYLRDWAMAHFYFHLVTAYDILRHHGVGLGKADYVSHVGYALRPGGPDPKGA